MDSKQSDIDDAGLISVLKVFGCTVLSAYIVIYIYKSITKYVIARSLEKMLKFKKLSYDCTK